MATTPTIIEAASRHAGDDGAYQTTSAQAVDQQRCWLDVLPLDVLHREVALRHVWVMSHLVLAYPRYAKYCRDTYAHMPDDAWRQFAATKRLKRARSSLLEFKRCAVTFIPMPIDHPRAPPRHDKEWRHACRMASPKSRHQMLQPNQTLQIDGSAIANDNDPLVRWVVHSCIWARRHQSSSTPDDPNAAAAAAEQLLPAIVPIAHVNSANEFKRDPRFAAWLRYGALHRDADQPAIYAAGSKWWYRDGKLHRDGDLPAVIYTSGTQWWCRDGELHSVVVPRRRAASRRR